MLNVAAVPAALIVEAPTVIDPTGMKEKVEPVRLAPVTEKGALVSPGNAYRGLIEVIVGIGCNVIVPTFTMPPGTGVAAAERPPKIVPSGPLKLAVTVMFP